MAYAIKKGSDYFNTVLWTGDATTSRAITGVGFSPDLVWAKSRTNAYSSRLYDTIRGATKELYSAQTTAETTTTNSLLSFDSDGFTVGDVNSLNQSGSAIVAWNWRGSDSAAVTNTDGSITSTVSANPTSGFSVVTYTGDGTTTTVGHGLGTTPKLLIMKNRDISQNWHVYTTVIDGTLDYFNLNTTDAKVDSGLSLPTSSVFSVGSSTSGLANDYVAYCFAEVEGFSKFSKYTGNGSTDGPFVYTGFKPAFVITKRVEAIDINNLGRWKIHDTARDTYNPMGKELETETANAEGASTRYFDFLSNGFKVRDTNTMYNANGYTYIYMAFAETPLKYATAR